MRRAYIDWSKITQGEAARPRSKDEVTISDLAQKKKEKDWRCSFCL